MLSEFIKTTRDQQGVSLEEIAAATGLSLELVKGLEDGQGSATLDEANKVLNYLGGQLGVGLTERSVWKGKEYPKVEFWRSICPLSANNAGQRRPPLSAYGHNPIDFLLQYLDDSNLEEIKSAISKAVEYYEPRVTVQQVHIAPSDDNEWKIDVYFFDHESKMIQNVVMPYFQSASPAELPEMKRRQDYHQVLRDRQKQRLLDLIENHRWIEERGDEPPVDLEITQLNGIDVDLLDSESKELLKKFRTKLETRQNF